MYLRLLPIFLVFWCCSCTQDTERRDDYAIQGIDVSRYQSVVDWDKIAAQEVHFAFIKATEGATHTDSLFERNWKQIRATGIRRGAYAAVRLENGDMPPVLDIETLDGSDPRKLVPALKTWLVLIRRHYGVMPILYTNLHFYNKHLAGQFADYPLWIARYGDDLPVLACGRSWQFWQYGSRGTLLRLARIEHL
jgi:lysozyme